MFLAFVCLFVGHLPVFCNQDFNLKIPTKKKQPSCLYFLHIFITISFFIPILIIYLSPFLDLTDKGSLITFISYEDKLNILNSTCRVSFVQFVSHQAGGTLYITRNSFLSLTDCCIIHPSALSPPLEIRSGTLNLNHLSFIGTPHETSSSTIVPSTLVRSTFGSIIHSREDSIISTEPYSNIRCEVMLHGTQIDSAEIPFTGAPFISSGYVTQQKVQMCTFSNITFTPTHSLDSTALRPSYGVSEVCGVYETEMRSCSDTLHGGIVTGVMDATETEFECVNSSFDGCQRSLHHCIARRLRRGTLDTREEKSGGVICTPSASSDRRSMTSTYSAPQAVLCTSTHYSLTSVSFTSCSSELSGGALFIHTSGSVTTLDGCAFTHCSVRPFTLVNGGSGGGGGGGGGGVWVDGRVSITHTHFIHCTSEGDGGALYISGEAGLSISNSQFINCRSEMSGGGVYWNIVQGSSSLTPTTPIFTSVTFCGNTASRSGADVYITSLDTLHSSPLFSQDCITYTHYTSTTASSSSSSSSSLSLSPIDLSIPNKQSLSECDIASTTSDEKTAEMTLHRDIHSVGANGEEEDSIPCPVVSDYSTVLHVSPSGSSSSTCTSTSSPCNLLSSAANKLSSSTSSALILLMDGTHAVSNKSDYVTIQYGSTITLSSQSCTPSDAIYTINCSGYYSFNAFVGKRAYYCRNTDFAGLTLPIGKLSPPCGKVRPSYPGRVSPPSRQSQSFASAK